MNSIAFFKHFQKVICFLMKFAKVYLAFQNSTNMKTFLPGLLLVGLMGLFFQSNAQVKKIDPARLKKNQGGTFAVPMLNGCDSIGWPPIGQSITWYTVPTDSGYLSGNNIYDDKAKGNFFDMTGSTANYVNRAIIGLGPVNAKAGGPLTAAVNVKVLDGTSGSPGAVLGTFNSTLQEMRDRRLGFTYIVFSPAVSLPPSKRFFLFVEFPGIGWTVPAFASTNDTITLLSTALNEPAVSIGWEQWDDNSFHSMEDGWGVKLNHHLYPIVSESTDGCNTLPVSFGTFTGEASSTGIDLNWQTITERNNQRFEVERSTDALKFTAVGTVLTKAVNGNHQGLLLYQFTDGTPEPGTNFYRIRQIDKDGSSEYSKLVKISFDRLEDNAIVRSYYPNPVSDKLIIQLGAGVRNVEAVRLSDASGKILASQKPAVSPEGIMNVSTKGLKTGLCFATVILPNGQQTTIKVIKN